MSIRKQITTLLLLLTAWPLAAQEVTAELRHDITEVAAQDAAHRLQRLRSGLGDAFNTQIFVETFADALRRGQPVEDIAQTRCPMAADVANGVLKRFEPRDMEPETVIARVQELAALPAPATDEEKDRQWESYMKLYDRMAAAYRPVLRLREAEKEREILSANAKRAGVTVLPNGVQMETEPGTAELANINRSTRETGVAFYTRTTRKTEFPELPEAIRRMAEHIPPARSWTFWVPAETVAALAAEKTQKKDSDAERRRQLMHLLAGPQEAHRRAQPWYREPKQEKQKKSENKLPEPMLKIKVWKDDENAPVQTLPDVVQDML